MGGRQSNTACSGPLHRGDGRRGPGGGDEKERRPLSECRGRGTRRKPSDSSWRKFSAEEDVGRSGLAPVFPPPLRGPSGVCVRWCVRPMVYAPKTCANVRRLGIATGRCRDAIQRFRNPAVSGHPASVTSPQAHLLSPPRRGLWRPQPVPQTAPRPA